MGDKEIQFVPEFWRFEREKGGWEPQKTVLRKESEELPLLFFTTVLWGSNPPFSLSNLQSSGHMTLEMSVRSMKSNWEFGIMAG